MTVSLRKVEGTKDNLPDCPICLSPVANSWYEHDGKCQVDTACFDQWAATRPVTLRCLGCQRVAEISTDLTIQVKSAAQTALYALACGVAASACFDTGRFSTALVTVFVVPSIMGSKIVYQMPTPRWAHLAMASIFSAAACLTWAVAKDDPRSIPVGTLTGLGLAAFYDAY